MRLLAGAALALAACGRVSFDAVPTDAALPDDGSNLVFVSSRTITPGALPSLSVADAACTAEARENGVPGDFVAWLSFTTSPAPSRFGAARGWRRVDGVAVADTLQDIVNERMYAPPNLDLHGARVDEPIATGTAADGSANGTCSDGTNPGDDVTFGAPSSTTGRFTDYTRSSLSCASPSRMYCFGVSATVPVAKPDPVAGVLIFVADNWPGDGALTVSMTYCDDVAGAAGLPGSYQPYYTSGGPLVDELDLTRGPVVRIDGVVVAPTIGDLATDTMRTSANLAPDGTTRSGPVWSGSPSPQIASTGPDSCQGWSSGNQSLFAWTGDLGAVGPGFFSRDELGEDELASCIEAHPIYCIAR